MPVASSRDHLHKDQVEQCAIFGLFFLLALNTVFEMTWYEIVCRFTFCLSVTHPSPIFANLQKNHAEGICAHYETTH